MNRRSFFKAIAGAAVAIRHGDWAAFKRSIAGPKQSTHHLAILDAMKRGALHKLNVKLVISDMSDYPTTIKVGDLNQYKYRMILPG